MATTWLGDGFLIEDAGDTLDPITLMGGRYAAMVEADFSGGGTVTLQAKAASGNFVTVLTAFSADGYGTVELPPGQYRTLVAFADSAQTATDADAALGLAEDAQTAVEAIAGSHPVAEGLAQAVVDAAQAVVDAIAASQPGTAALAVTAAEAASALAQLDPDISGDAPSMTALGDYDTALATSSATVAAAPTAISASLSAVPTRRGL